MKFQKLILASAVSLATISSANAAPTIYFDSGNDTFFTNANDLLKAQNRVQRSKSVSDQIANEVRLRTLSDYAKQVAMQVSMRAGMKNINTVLKENSRQLDAIYNFQPLMIHSKIVPPVVTEAVDLYNQSGAMQVRLTDRVYDIVSQARISSTPPNWRDYLNFPNEQDAYNDYIYLTAGMKPETSLEKKIWEEATKEGWDIGISQSNTVLLEAMDRLNRDYVGMIRFHRLVAEGKLDMPAISRYDLYDNSTGSRLLMGEKLFQITSLPQFKKVPTDVKRVLGGEVSDLGYLQHSEVMEHDKPVTQEPENVVVNEQVSRAQNNIPVIDTPNWLKTDIEETAYIRSVITRKILNDVQELDKQTNPPATP